ncbi:hypothetical protein [Vibrio quintilis]|nr:hypothetical protein [Vibrio quintilis]
MVETKTIDETAVATAGFPESGHSKATKSGNNKPGVKPGQKSGVKTRISGITHPPANPFVILQGETYKSAMIHWLKSDGYKGIAWAIYAGTRERLKKVATKNDMIPGDPATVSAALSAKLGVKLSIATNEKLKYAAIHEWHDLSVKIVKVHGNTLKGVLKNLVTDFGWNWNDQQSWRTHKNLHGFSIPFPLVAPVDDIGLLLNQVLANRPVRAEYFEDTQTVFVTDDK